MKSGLSIIIVAVIVGGYFIPISAEQNLEQKRQKCIDEYIFVLYDFMKRHNLEPLALSIYMTDWFERCYDTDWSMSREEFFERVNELGYGEKEIVI